MLFSDNKSRATFIDRMKSINILCVFRYLSLHKSDFYKEKHDGRVLNNADLYSETLVRLPLFYDLEVKKVIKKIVMD